MDDEEEKLKNKDIKMSYIIQKVNKHMFISKIESLLYQENVPPLFVCSLIKFMKCLKSDFKNCLPIFTTLDIWSILSQYLKPHNVMKKYSNDHRQLLYKGKNKRLTSFEEENSSKITAFALDSISIIQFVLESVKKDHQLASIIVRSVPFIENMFKCLVFLLKNDEIEKDILDILFFS